MDEAGSEEAFDIEGPLWIQVQAMEKGLEITVTKAQLSKDGEDIELPSDVAKFDSQLDNKLEDLLDLQLGKRFNQKDRLSDDDEAADRKSTRLNSSHVAISYAVFCLKKKKNNATE